MTDDDLIRLARERFDEAYSADQENREMSSDDMRFVTGDQWPDGARQEREAKGKP